MAHLTPEEENLKKTIFDQMNPKRQKHILKKGYDDWDPFQKPKDPIDMRTEKTRRTSQALVREFLQSISSEQYSNDYGRGVFDLCMGIINQDDRYIGMFDFACWYKELLRKEGHGGIDGSKMEG